VRRARLDVFGFGSATEIGRIEQHHHLHRARKRLSDQLQPLRAEFAREGGQAGQVAAGMLKASPLPTGS